ncbi:MAG: class I SAM-dependent methyltransferase family protein [Halobacteriaceae archaeon]
MPSADDDAADADATVGAGAGDLAAVVAKPETERAIDALREEGVYDDSRSAGEFGPDAVALPVTDPPTETPVREVVRSAALERREDTLEARLRDRGWSDEQVDAAPGSWAVVGDVVLVAFGDCHDREAVAEELRDLHGADTVLARHGVSGEHREPDVEVVAGSGETETVHVEHGTKYALDLAEVLFSPGNKAERARMGEVVDPGERVLDMFAGVGYFALPMARAGAAVTAVEKNPTAVRYLAENAVLNGVGERVTPVRADCREVAVDPADRVVMGYYDATEREYLDAALEALAPGGRLHVHAACPEARLWERPVSRLEDAVAAAGREVTALDRRRVKGHSEGVAHVVLDATVD